MARLMLVALAFVSVLTVSGTALAQSWGWGGCYRDPYTGEQVCERGRASVAPRPPVCYPVRGTQCGFDAWGNQYCVEVVQVRCR